MHWPSLDSVSIVQGHTLVRITTTSASYCPWESNIRDPGPEEKGKELSKKEREGGKEGGKEEEEKKRERGQKGERDEGRVRGKEEGGKE